METKMIDNLIADFNEKANLTKLLFYFNNNKVYIALLIKQLETLSQNIKSIDALLSINNVQDAYSIYRKFLETYFVIFSVFNNPQCVQDFVRHNELQRKKLLNREDQEIKQIVANNIEGYLEHGYILKYLDKTPKKLSMFDVCKFGKCMRLFEQYKISNQFVHNNLTSVKIDDVKAKQELIEALDENQNRLVKEFRKIYK